MCLLVTPLRLGANLPRGSAPPEAAKLWHAVQFVLKNWPPRTTSALDAPVGSYSDFDGIAGPGPSEATYAASWLLYSGEYTTFLRWACTPGRAIGIRPVPTWKSTAAAPTPARGGAYWVPRLVTMPSPFLPWHEAQPTRNRARLLATVDWSAVFVEAVAGERTAYRPPVTSRPISRTTRPASGLRRLAESRAERSRTGCPLFCPGSCPGRGRPAVLRGATGSGRSWRTDRSTRHRRSASSRTRRWR